MWIQKFLWSAIASRSDLSAYRNRIVLVSGSDDVSPVDRMSAIRGFAPVSMQAPAGRDADLYEIIITTDVLAEGVNLQQCWNIINFDMPCNPMRLVQRHGRIDRIGSTHRKVFLRTTFPFDRLERLLNLEGRILNKIAMDAASVGVTAPISGAQNGTQVFTETREEIEKLMMEDPSIFELGGTSGGAQTEEEYRQTLRKALEGDSGHFRRLPWKIGSGMKKRSERGVFFCAVVGFESKFERTFMRFVCADDDWNPNSDPVAMQRELGTCLRLLECDQTTAVVMPQELQEGVYAFWELAQHDIRDDWMEETDPANTQPEVRLLNRRVAKVVREHRPAGVSDKMFKRALDILESPWPRREESMLREWFKGGEQTSSDQVEQLINRILNSGLVPSEPPPVLPPIELEDVELKCWMAIES